MALRNVVKNDNEFLGKKSRPVERFDEKLEILVNDMRDTLRKEQGAGLAAPQIGVLRRIFVADINMNGSEYKEFINPEIVSATGKNDRYLEGCLSYPGRSFRIVRAHKVTVRAQNVKGEVFEFTGEDFVARCLLHEYDHLEGITIPMIGDEVFENVVYRLKEGGNSVVLQHDTKSFSVAAVASIIEYALANGYLFDKLDASSFPAHHGVNN